MKKHYFPYLATAAFTAFATLIITVVGISYSRRHGRTGIDMAEMQNLREKATLETSERR